MAVICDTSKVSVCKNGNCWAVYIRGIKSAKGNSLIFKIADYDPLMSKDLLYTMFFEKLEKRGFVTRDGGVLCQNDKGNYYIARGEDAPAYEAKPTQVFTPKTIVGGPHTLFDPHTPEAKALIGKPVLGSTTFVFSEGTCVIGTLEALNGMFHIKTRDGLVSVPFIRERRPEPLKFNDTATRRSLLGKILVSKDVKHELMITLFVKDGNCWKANGMNATQMMNGYTFEDGSEIMASA